MRREDLIVFVINGLNMKTCPVCNKFVFRFEKHLFSEHFEKTDIKFGPHEVWRFKDESKCIAFIGLSLILLC